MGNIKSERLSDEALMKVSGGAKAVDYEAKKTEFENAWDDIIRAKGVQDSGMRRAEVYLAWERAGFSNDAATFILNNQ